MHVRTGRVSFSPDKVDDLISHVRDTIIPMYEGTDGYKGFRLLVDRESGRAQGVSFWDSEEQMRAQDEVAGKARAGAAEAGGGSVEGVEYYEMVIDAT